MDQLFRQWASGYFKNPDDVNYMNTASTAQIQQLFFGEYENGNKAANYREKGIHVISFHYYLHHCCHNHHLINHHLINHHLINHHYHHYYHYHHYHQYLKLKNLKKNIWPRRTTCFRRTLMQNWQHQSLRKF